MTEAQNQPEKKKGLFREAVEGFKALPWHRKLLFLLPFVLLLPIALFLYLKGKVQKKLASPGKQPTPPAQTPEVKSAKEKAKQEKAKAQDNFIKDTSEDNQNTPDNTDDLANSLDRESEQS